MNTKTTIPISEARKKIFDIAEKVQKPNTYYTLTENGRPKAVILSVDEFESIIETIDILSDPKLMNNIRKAEEEYKKGDYVKWNDIKEKLGIKKTLK